MTIPFRDFFSKQASVYTQFRPSYPKALFEYLSSLAAAHDTVWDCATGNGQAAVDLAGYFNQVIATDASAAQIEHAIAHERVSYAVGSAEMSGLEAHSVDLITVAQAVHWFDFEKFYAEARRVMRERAIIAVWAYAFHQTDHAPINKLLDKVGKEILADYWQVEPKLIWMQYKSLPFPFKELPSPTFQLQVEWDLKTLIGYFSTWSATQKYREVTGMHPIESVFDELLSLWGDPELKRTLSCPIYLRVGLHETHEAIV